MAKEKYVIQAELDTKGVLSSAREAQREINNIGRLAKETNKNAQITGSVTMKDKGIKETQRALNLAKQNVDNLTKALANAKMSGATQKQVQALESQLVKAQTQATRLSTELAKVGSQSVQSNGLSSAVDKMKSAGGSLLGTFSKVGNVISGISSAIGLVSGGISKAVDLTSGFANTLMNTYDRQIQAQKTLSTTLSDGAKGYEQFNGHIDKGNSLLKSQKNDLNELGATISSYMKVSGDEAYKTVNAINAVGDSLGLSTDTQKQFTYGLAQALGSGTLHAQDFNQMMQSALGAQFRDMLIQAANEMQNVGTTAEQLPDALKKGKVEANLLANTFGDNWASKMAKAQTALKGIEVSTGGVKRMLKDGQLSVQDFTNVFGESFTSTLLNAMNATSNGAVTMENFKEKMEDGVFSTEVMNRAIELFQQKGEQLASSGPSTWGQIREMISNGFNTSALDGFRKGLGDAGIDMASLGNNATEMSSIVGSQLGKMAGQAVGAVTKIIDKNKDGKVSQDEMKDAVNDAKKAVEKFFNKINFTSIGSFLDKVGSIVSQIRDVYNWANNAYSAVQNLLSASRNIGGNTGLLGKALGFRKNSTWGDAFSDFHWGWLRSNIDPLGIKEPTSLGKKILGSRNGQLPLDLQFFAGGREAISRAVNAVQPYARATKGTTATPSIGTQDNSQQDIKIYVQSSADGRRIANEIYNKLERNGVKLNKR
ncbi:tail length tape measure protein [Lactococcus phage 50102]|uniref:Tape measure protein n=1 Tax=Lactococcus phage 50102 TaxID=2024336 RepID=A0A2Z2RWU4_9CAUD|nr:tail length tape measure protein [Lactococcus phage 50102]ASZ70892.1 tape measure protein [Lactococcus phage 50102]